MDKFKNIAELEKAYNELEVVFTKKCQELKQLEKSDASKEQSSIDYYGLYRELKAENKELKERLDKAEAKLFITVRNNIAGEAVGDTDVIALMIIRNFDEMIDFEKAIKSKAEAEARLKELKEKRE